MARKNSNGRWLQKTKIINKWTWNSPNTYWQTTKHLETCPMDRWDHAGAFGESQLLSVETQRWSMQRKEDGGKCATPYQKATCLQQDNDPTPPRQTAGNRTSVLWSGLLEPGSKNPSHVWGRSWNLQSGEGTPPKPETPGIFCHLSKALPC